MHVIRRSSGVGRSSWLGIWAAGSTLASDFVEPSFTSFFARLQSGSWTVCGATRPSCRAGRGAGRSLVRDAGLGVNHS